MISRKASSQVPIPPPPSGRGLEAAPALPTPAPPLERAPSRTSFDFLEGRYAAAERTRRLNLIVAASFLALVVLIGGLSVQHRLAAGTLDTQRSDVESALSATELEISRANSTGAITASQLRRGLDRWATLAAKPLTGRHDLTRILADLSAVEGVSYSLISISAAPPPDATGAGATATPTQAAPVVTSPPGTEASPASATLQVQGTAPDLATVTALVGIFTDPNRFPYLQGVTAPYQCGSGASGCTFTLNAQITDTAHTAQPDEIRARLTATPGGG